MATRGLMAVSGKCCAIVTNLFSDKTTAQRLGAPSVAINERSSLCDHSMAETLMLRDIM